MKGKQEVKDITWEWRPLNECGLVSGSVLLVKPRSQNENCTFKKSLQQALIETTAERGPDFNRCGSSVGAGPSSGWNVSNCLPRDHDVSPSSEITSRNCTQHSSNSQAIPQEICNAHLMAVLDMEQLKRDDVNLPLRNRDGHRVPTIADDSVKDEPVFLLDRRYEHLIRASIVHKDQNDSANYTIKHITVQPTDGHEFRLDTFDCTSSSPASEVVALFPFDWFQSSRLSSTSAKSGTIEDRNVSVAVTIGVDVKSTDPDDIQVSAFELKGRILCRPVLGYIAGIQTFRRFASEFWRNSPEWMRSGGQGAIILTSVALEDSVKTAQPLITCNICSVLRKLFILPCFRSESLSEE